MDAHSKEADADRETGSDPVELLMAEGLCLPTAEREEFFRQALSEARREQSGLAEELGARLALLEGLGLDEPGTPLAAARVPAAW
jgi:hypothetical protein